MADAAKISTAFIKQYLVEPCLTTQRRHGHTKRLITKWSKLKTQNSLLLKRYASPKHRLWSDVRPSIIVAFLHALKVGGVKILIAQSINSVGTRLQNQGLRKTVVLFTKECAVYLQIWEMDGFIRVTQSHFKVVFLQIDLKVYCFVIELII